MKEKLRVAMMVLLTAALLVMAGGFWTFVSMQAEKERTEEEAAAASEEEPGGIEAMYIALGADGDSYIFADGNGLFEAEIPEDALYNENGKKITREELYTGDVLKLYGDIVAGQSEPPLYSGVEKIVRTSRGSVEDAKTYASEIQIYTGMPICARERENKTLTDE